MASFNKFNSFVAAVANGLHDLSTNQLVVALTNSSNAPTATDSQLSDLTQISYTNLSSRNITTTSSTQTGGLYSLQVTDLVLSATGTVATFRYIVVYDEDATNNELIGWYDRGSDVTLENGESLTLDFDQVNGLLTLQ